MTMRNFPLVFDRLSTLREQHPDRMSRAKMKTALAVGQDYEARYGEAWVALENDGSLTIGGCQSVAGRVRQDTLAITRVAPDGTATVVA